MGDIVSLAAYKKEKGIASPRSPYYTLKATDKEIQFAMQQAHHLILEEKERTGKLAYAVVIGYEEKNGRVKLLKEMCLYSNRESFEMTAGRRNMKVLGLIAKEQ